MIAEWMDASEAEALALREQGLSVFDRDILIEAHNHGALNAPGGYS